MLPPPSTLAVSRPRPASSPAQYAARSSLGEYPGSFFLSSRTDGGAACDLHRRGPSTDRLPRDIITSNLRWVETFILTCRECIVEVAKMNPTWSGIYLRVN
uniref:Uncharacterized protein n=1 Tax=Zea mays TaxID=4577 RepID=A0A804MJP3_MAIZE